MYVCIFHGYNLTPVVGSQARLMKSNECVGIATLVEGDVLHGHKVPTSYRKVFLEAIKQGISPELKGQFEDDCLCIGQFTVQSNGVYLKYTCTMKLCTIYMKSNIPCTIYRTYVNEYLNVNFTI